MITYRRVHMPRSQEMLPLLREEDANGLHNQVIQSKIPMA